MASKIFHAVARSETSPSPILNVVAKHAMQTGDHKLLLDLLDNPALPAKHVAAAAEHYLSQPHGHEAQTALFAVAQHQHAPDETLRKLREHRAHGSPGVELMATQHLIHRASDQHRGGGNYPVDRSCRGRSYCSEYGDSRYRNEGRLDNFERYKGLHRLNSLYKGPWT